MTQPAGRRDTVTAAAPAGRRDGVIAAGEALVLLAAGGSGGHMLPAEALAGALLDRGRAVALVTDDRGAAFNTRLPQVTVYRIRAASPLGGGLVARMQGAWLLLRGLIGARQIVRRQRPSVVVGFGGYASVPTVLAATAAGIPSLLHEQNAVLGRANRLLAGRVQAIATGFPTLAAIADGDRAKVTHTGNPVRPAVRGLAGRPYAAAAPGGVLSLLVLGGSQGATVLSEVVPAAIALLPADKQARLQVAQQCRAEDIDTVRARYKAMGLHPELSTFFGDAPHRLARCHLAITRAGASTAAELTAIGVPAVLVPYLHAMDDHQSGNARSLAAAVDVLRQVPAGGRPPAAASGEAGWFTPASVADRLSAALDDPAALAARATAAAGLGRPDAADRLAALVDRFLPPVPAAAPDPRNNPNRSSGRPAPGMPGDAA